MLLAATLALAQAPDHAWIFVLDGLRDSEGIGVGEENLPWLWNVARPQGTLVTPLLNRDTTQTDGAHRMALSGRRQPNGGFPWYPGRSLNRAFTPTVFEAVALARELGVDGGYVNGNTVFMDSQGRSVYPGLQRVGAWEFPSEEDSTISDVELTRHLRAWRDDHDPAVMLLNLHEADKNGHAGLWDPYIASIRGADALIESFAADGIGDNDVVFVFADHGRHLDEEWRGHTDQCSGCRTSFLLAWGPGIAQGGTVEGDWELDDVAPTLAAAMGVELPTARGRVIAGLLEAERPVPESAALLVDPEIVRATDGRLHLFAHRLRNASEGEGIVHRVSDDEGQSWADAGDLPVGLEWDSPEELRALAWGDRLLVAWRAWLPALGQWGVLVTEGEGDVWADPVVVDDGVFHDTVPSFGVSPSNGEPVGWWWTEIVGISDPPADLTRVAWSGAWTDTTVVGDGSIHIPTAWSVVPTGGGLVATFAAIADEDYVEGNDNREVYVLRGAESSAPEVVRVSTSAEPSYWPSLARTTDGRLHLVWNERRGATVDEGGWELRYASSDDDGVTWSAPVELSTEGEPWRPSLLASGIDLVLAWTQVTTGTHRLRVAPIEKGSTGGILGEASTLAEGGAVDRIAAAPIPEGWVLAWSEAEATDDHRLRTARVGVGGVPLDGVEGTQGDSGTGSPGRRCGCASASPLASLPLLAWWRDRRGGRRRQGRKADGHPAGVRVA